MEYTPGDIEIQEGTQTEINLLFEKLLIELSQHIHQLFSTDRLMQLNEVYLQLGQYPECIFAEGDGRKTRHRILDHPCTTAEINIFAEFFDSNIQTTGNEY